MAKSFSILRDKMSPESRRVAEEKAQKMLKELRENKNAKREKSENPHAAR